MKSRRDRDPPGPPPNHSAVRPRIARPVGSARRRSIFVHIASYVLWEMFRKNIQPYFCCRIPSWYHSLTYQHHLGSSHFTTVRFMRNFLALTVKHRSDLPKAGIPTTTTKEFLRKDRIPSYKVGNAPVTLLGEPLQRKKAHGHSQLFGCRCP
ncbi:hypothetical protein EVAR_61128_1 [Eumeta japonica]|uniref:Uncharacterized protein n=1 Tax=Eumeta variegata TaxID=151549 RepID=A0A4C1ZHN9_EUMVA|nr:hypothetical protein EVAR_61128_1 [Eumeta japonica]